MKKTDPNRLAKIERAIAQKYGDEAVQDVRADWDEEKEKAYLEQLKQLSKKQSASRQQSEKTESSGFLISRKLLNKDSHRSCPVCLEYSFKSRDDVYMTKFECCYRCFIEWVEGREERWLSGWRPNNENE